MALLAQRFLALIALLATLAQGRSQLRNEGLVQSFIRNLEFKQSLRVCNGYARDEALDVYVGKRRLTPRPLGYKQCDTFAGGAIAVGERLDFRAADVSIGTFNVEALPQSDAVLLLVIYRHDAQSTSVAFESHVFPAGEMAQVAVIDTYKGKANTELRIRERKSDANGEILRYGTAIGVNPGIYEVSLVNAGGKEIAFDNLVALNNEAYVILRVGIDAQIGQKYEEELLVYPRSDPSFFQKSASIRASMGKLAAFLLTIFGFCF